MKAAVINQYGGPEVIEIKDVPTPEPKADEILIQVMNTTVTMGDCEFRGMYFYWLIRFMLRLFYGFFKPRALILGQELSGIVIKTGEKIETFKVGDAVVATTGMHFGGYGEYIVLKEHSKGYALVRKPDLLSFETAAATPIGAMESEHFLSVPHIKPGDRVLINGAGGSIGSFGIQFAKLKGAQVIAVDTVEKFDHMRATGADQVIDYRTENPLKGQHYDVIFDVVGKLTYYKALRSLKENGYYLIANPTFGLMFRSKLTNLLGQKHVYMQMTAHTDEALTKILQMIETGDLKVMIDRIMPLEDIEDAHAYVESGQKKGSLVIQVGEKNR